MTSSTRARMLCPSGGTFWACVDQPVKFVGCCATDPCTRGCAAGSLYPASYVTNDYDLLRDQECDTGGRPYSCNFTTPAFWGCCKVNACQASGLRGCPVEQLSPGILRSQPALYAFLEGYPGAASSAAASRPSGSSSSSTASTAGAAAAATDGSTSSASGKTSSTPIIVGVVVGVIALALLIIVAIVCMRKRKKKQHAATVPAETTGGISYAPGTMSETLEADDSTAMNSPSSFNPVHKAYAKTYVAENSPNPSAFSAFDHHHNQQHYQQQYDIPQYDYSYHGTSPQTASSARSGDFHRHARDWSGSTTYAHSPTVPQYQEMHGSSAWHTVPEMSAERQA